VITTQWHTEKDRVEVLLSKMWKQDEGWRGDDLRELSEQGVRFIVLSALTDPENEAQIRTLEEPKKSKGHLQKRLIKRIIHTNSVIARNEMNLRHCRYRQCE
jgi:hypothetical protein